MLASIPKNPLNERVSDERASDLDYPSPYPCKVLLVKTGREFDVKRQLEMRDIHAYVPACTILRPRSEHRPQPVKVPLFRGYVFSCFAPVMGGTIRTISFVYDLLRFGMREAVVEEEEMSMIQLLAIQAGVEPWEQIANGSRVRIIEGPLKGLEGKLIEHKGHMRVVVEIEMLSRSVSAVVDSWTIEAVKAVH